jgi:hypothetical protein
MCPSIDAEAGNTPFLKKIVKAGEGGLKKPEISCE